MLSMKGSLHGKRRRKREDCLLHVTDEAKNKIKNDKVVTIDFADSTRDWRATCMETDVLAERKKINKKKKCGAWSRNTSY